MIKNSLEQSIKDTLGALGIEYTDIVLEHPADLKMGDYSTNIAMMLAKNLKKNPKQLAQEIVEVLNTKLPDEAERVEVAGAGFINFYLKKDFFTHSVKAIIRKDNFGNNESLKGKKIMVEYTDPNPFKPVHIGHLMTNAIGESVSRIYEASGADVMRANYQGDVGLHVAKAIYALLKNPNYIKKNVSIKEQAEYIGKAYADGSHAYESAEIKEEIDEINKKIYARSDETINELYDWGFKVTMEAFEELYKVLGSRFDYYFLESKMVSVGESIVRENLGTIFHESDGALVFKGEDYDSRLHTRVFITSKGLPTYETKELGLTLAKFEERKDLNESVVITANEQADYMRVVAKAVSLMYPEYEKKMRHITHGMMRFAVGKMSSRLGNVITGEDLLKNVREGILEKVKERDFSDVEMENVVNAVAVSAIKYSILKQSIGGDIIFDFEKSISFEGDSGPYLQYSYARARSIVEKAQKEGITPNFDNTMDDLTETERMLYRFPEIVERACIEDSSHYIASYLIELARGFNSFYGNNQIVDTKDKTSPYKVALTEAFANVMKRGLYLLGISAPEKM